MTLPALSAISSPRSSRFHLAVLAACALVPSTLAMAQQTTPTDSTPDQLIAQARATLTDDPAQAKDLLTQALVQSPNSPPANLLLGDLLLSEHLYPEAMDRFETVLAIDLRNSSARTGERNAAVALALQARSSGNPAAALATLQHAHEALPDDATLLTDLGVQQQAMHLLQPAAASLTSALALDPSNLTALYALARVETDQENFASAEQHFRSYLAARPNDASAHYGLGWLIQLQLHTDAASAEFQRSIALQPLQTESYFQLGQIALDGHRADEARSMFQKTLSRAPTHGGALTGLGILDYRAKDYPAARESLTRAIQSYPDYQPAHYYLGLTLTRLGDKAAATRELALAADLARKQQGKSQPIPAGTLP